MEEVNVFNLSRLMLFNKLVALMEDTQKKKKGKFPLVAGIVFTTHTLEPVAGISRKGVMTLNFILRIPL